MVNKEIISDKQGIILIVIFITGTSTIIVTGLEAGRDVWISTLIAVFMTLPLAIVYARLNILFPDKNIFDIFAICFGKFGGKFMSLLLTSYSFILSALILRDFGEFSRIIAASNTPMIVTMIFLGILSAWIVKEGLEVMGRFSEFFILLMLILMMFFGVLLIYDMEINNIRPVLQKGFKPVLKGAFSSFGFPFGEIVIFTMVFKSFKFKKSAYKVYLFGLTISGVILVINALINTLVLGANTMSSLYFPSYTTISRLDIGDFLQRLEIIVSFLFFIGGFVKLSVCLLSTSEGISKVFGIKNYRIVVTPVSVLTIILSYIIVNNIMELIEFSSRLYVYYALPFQVVIPIIVLIIGEVKYRKNIGNGTNE